MKNLLLALSLTILITSCSDDDAQQASIIGTWKITSLTSNGVEELDGSGSCFWHEVYTETTVTDINFSGDNCDIETVTFETTYTIENNVLTDGDGDFYVISELTESTLKLTDSYEEEGENYVDVYTYSRQ